MSKSQTRKNKDYQAGFDAGAEQERKKIVSWIRENCVMVNASYVSECLEDGLHLED